MSVDTKGVVLTTCKDVMFVSRLVEKTINRMIRVEHKATRPIQGLCTTTLSTESELVRISFTFQGDSRMLNVLFGCDVDHLDLAPQCLCLSMGDWGNSRAIMKTVLRSLSCLGEVWLDECDCDTEPLSVFPVPTLTYLEACKQGIEHASMQSLATWVAQWKQGHLHGGKLSCEEQLGLAEAKIEDILAMSYENSSKLLDARVATA